MSLEIIECKYLYNMVFINMSALKLCRVSCFAKIARISLISNGRDLNPAVTLYIIFRSNATYYIYKLCIKQIDSNDIRLYIILRALVKLETQYVYYFNFETNVFSSSLDTVSNIKPHIFNINEHRGRPAPREIIFQQDYSFFLCNKKNITMKPAISPENLDSPSYIISSVLRRRQIKSALLL